MARLLSSINTYFRITVQLQTPDLNERIYRRHGAVYDKGMTVREVQKELMDMSEFKASSTLIS